MKSYTLGIDVGGTFTDFLLLNSEDQTQIIDKVSSTPSDPSIGVLNGIEGLAKKLSMNTEDLLQQTKLIVHGTTVTTNAVLTSTGAKTGLLTTKGFRDILQMRRGVRSREHLYDNKYTAPSPLITRDYVIGIDERTDLHGEILKDVNEQEVAEAVEWFREEGIESVAICFMHSYANPENEMKAKELVQKWMPEAFVTNSYEVSPTVRLNNRVNTVSMNAYVGPILQKYMDKLIDKLKTNGFVNGELLIMQSNGGVTNPETVSRVPATTVLSGPAAGPVSGNAFAKSCGYTEAIVVDMGGTSFEASIIQDGNVAIKKEGEINRNLISLPMASIHTIGSGGGSIASIDSGGLLNVGPESAGASPGPVFYGRGGDTPTCSDANFILGYLDPSVFLEGDMEENKKLSREALENQIAKPMKRSLEEAALGIYQISNLNMANGIKEVTVQNGLDPREFPLVVAGGAGPIHAAMIARELQISEIIIPRFSSVLCAVGMLASNLRHDYVKSYQKNWESTDFNEIISVLEEDKIHGKKALVSEGVADEEHVIMYGLDMRYVGQHFEVTIEVPETDISANEMQMVEELFHSEHEQLFGFHLKGHEIEIVNVRLSCRGGEAQFSPQKIEQIEPGEEPLVKGERQIYDPVLNKTTNSLVYDGELMKAGSIIEGPAIIELETTTIVVPYEFEINLVEHGNFIMRDTTLEPRTKREEMSWIQS